MTKTYDALIIGARCAGAATALQLARAGAKVLLVDRAPTIDDTLSTHALLRPAVSLLDHWGLLKDVENSAPIVGATEFIYGPERITVPIKPFGNATGFLAPRRYVLDNFLLEAAAKNGAEVRLGQSCSVLIQDLLGLSLIHI